MAKFNQKSKNSGADIFNQENAPAYNMDNNTELYTRVLSTLMNEKKFYQSADGSDKELIALIRKVAVEDPEFVAGLAIIARNKFNLRSVPQVLMVELANIHKGDDIVSKAISAYMHRPDEMTEMLAYYGKRFAIKGAAKKMAKLPNQIKKGLASAFERFDEYQMAKYNRPGEVKLRDVLFLTHPVPVTKEQEKLWYDKLINGTLKTPDTWEVALSTAKERGLTKTEAWTEVLPKMGYMALLKNLRNLYQEGVDPDKFIPTLIDPEHNSKSRQFPFRFMSAYRELSIAGASSKIMDAVADAMELAVGNVPELPGITFVVSDNSASMGSVLSDKGSVSYKDIANLFAAIAHKKLGTNIVGVFGESYKTVGLSSRNSILANKEVLENTDVGHSTNTYETIDWLTKTKTKVDRIIIFSDMQAWDSRCWDSRINTTQESYDRYCATMGIKPHVYSIDLAGYGTSDFDPKKPQIHLLSGWSEKIFDYILAMETEPDAAMSDIYLAIADARV